MIAEFPQSKFRFRIYDNKSKLSWQDIKKNTGCYALLNLGYFELSTFKVADTLMVGGEWLCRADWSYWGILIDEAGALTVGSSDDAMYDYCNGEPVYCLHGQDMESSSFGKNGTTMLGVKDDGTVVALLVSKDNGITSQEGVKTLKERDCTSILRFDGSWSSQGSLGPDMDVDPSQERKVRSYLLIFEKEKEVTPVDDIRQEFMTHNRTYTNGRTITPEGIMVHSTASPGVTAQQQRDRWDNDEVEVSTHAMLDDKETIQALPWNARAWHCGAGGNNTHIAFEICEPKECRLLPIEWVALKRNGQYNATWVVERLQKELVARGYDPNGVDGKFGGGCEAAVKAFQKDNGLEVDGSCGPATKEALSNREGSYLRYNPEETKDYFSAIWDRAVSLCVYLCKEFGLDPEKDILCHAEGYRAGIASNHADVEHWFPEHGKSMDDFRAAVKAALNGGESEDTPAEEEPWYAEAQRWVQERGIADGQRPDDPATRAEVWTMLMRLAGDET